MRLQKYFKLKSEKLSRKARLITLLMILILVAAAILIVNQKVIHDKISTAFGVTLREWVTNETGGLYILAYDSMDISTLKRQITLQNVTFRPDSTVWNRIWDSESRPNDVYSISSPKLFLGISSLWQVIFQDKLEFSGIRLREPSVIIHNIEAPDSTQFSEESGDLYVKLEKYLDKFRINEFILTDGSVIYKKMYGTDSREYSIGNIDVYVDNFEVDATNKTAGTDRVRVVLKKPSFMLADGIHRVEMDSLLIDSNDQTVILNEVVVFPVYEMLRTENINETNLYNFNIPDIIIKGIDFTTAYRENKLNIKSIYIPNPEFIVDTHKKDSDGKKADQKDISVQLAQLFNTIHASDFLIEDAKLDLALEANDKTRNLHIQNTTIQIRDLDLDTLKYTHKNSHINFRSFDLSMEDYHLILPDSVHQMTVDVIKYSSDSSRLAISEIYIEPSDKLFSNQNRMNAYIPLVLLEGFEVAQYLREHKLVLDQILVNNPKIVFHNLKAPDSVSNAILNFALANNKLSDEISSTAININNVDFEFRKNGKMRSQLSNGTLSLSEFRLSQTLPTNPGMFLNSSHVAFHLPHLNFFTENMDEVTLTGVSGNLSSPRASIDELKFVSSSSPITLDGKNISIKGIEIMKLLNGEKLQIDTLTIGSATFISSETSNTTRVTKEEAEAKIPVNIKSLIFDNGRIAITDPKSFIINIDGIKGYFQELAIAEGGIESTDSKLFTEKITLYSEAKNLRIGAAKAELHPDRFILHLPYVEPIIKGSDSFISVNATQASLLGFNSTIFINDKKLHARQLSLLSTNIDFHKETEIKNDKPRSIKIDWDKLLKDKLEEIIIDRIIVSGPGLSFDTNGGQLAVDDYELELREFNTNSDGSTHLINSDNIRVKSSNFSYSKDDVTISAGKISLDENRRIITLDSFRFENSNSLLEIPKIFANQMDLKKLAEENKLIGRELDIAGFKITHRSSEKAADKKPAEKSAIPLIHFDFVNAHEGVVNLTNKDDEEIRINNIRWKLSDFDTENHADKPFYARHLEIKAGTLTGMINDGKDKMLIEGITLSDNGQTLRLDHLFLKPEFDKIKYAYEVGHETDWINVIANDIIFEGIDIGRMFSDDPAYIIRKGTIRSVDASVYRDKKLPVQQGKIAYLPQEALKRMKTPLALESLEIVSSDITYQELSESAFEPGELQFHNLNVVVENITNIPSRIKSQKKMTATIKGSIEGTSIFAKALFDLSSPKNEFVFTGQMGEGDLVKFNKILENNVFLRIEKGNSKGLTFNIKADDETAYGTMSFHYKNLKVSLIDKQTNKTSGFDESIISFFANTFVINSNNPRLFVLKEGNIYYPRDASKSIFNYWAKSFLSGVLSSIGMKSNKKQLKEALSEQE